MLHLTAGSIGGDGGVQAVALLALDFAAQVHMIGLAILQRRRGESDVHVVMGEVVGENRMTGLVRNDHQVIGGLGELKHHEQLLRVCLDGVVHIARADDQSAVDGGAHIGVDAAVLTAGVGQIDGRSAVEDDPAVGVNAVAFAAGQVLHGRIDITVVHGQHAHAVLGDIERVVAGLDVKHAAVDGHVAELDLHALVVRVHGQVAVTLKAQGHQGADRAVQLGIALLNADGVAASHAIDAALRQLDGHAVLTGSFGFLGRKDRDRRGRAAGDIHAVQDQADLILCTGAHGDLRIHRGAGNAVYAAVSNGHDLIGQFLQRRRYITVGFHLMGQVHGGCGIPGDRRAVHSDGLAQDDRRFLRFSRRNAKQQRQAQQGTQQFFHGSFLLTGYCHAYDSTSMWQQCEGIVNAM